MDDISTDTETVTIQKVRKTRPKRKPFTEETRRRMSEARKGVPKSDEHKAAIGLSNKGRKRTPEFCQLQSQLKKAYWENKV